MSSARVLVWGALALVACEAAPTTILLTVEAGPGVTVRRLTARVTVSGASSVESAYERPQLPGTLIIKVADVTGRITVDLGGEDDDGNALFATGTVDSRPHAQVSLTLTLTRDPGGGPDGGGPDGGAPDGGAPDGGDPGPCAKLATLVGDDFDDGVRAPFWGAFADPGTSVTEQNGRLVITPAMNTAPAHAGYFTHRYYDLRESHISIEIVQMVEPGSAQAYLQVRLDAGEQLEFLQTGGQLNFVDWRNGVGNDLGSVEWSAAVRFWRLRETAGTTYWETSSNGTVWTVRASQPSRPGLDHVQVQIGAGTYMSEPMPGVLRVDNVNGGPVSGGRWCPIATLRDTFSDGTAVPLWNWRYAEVGCTLSEASGEVTMSPSGAAGSECHYVASAAYDLTDGFVSVRIAGMVDTATSASAWLQVLGPDSSSVGIRQQQGTLACARQTQGGPSVVATLYEPAQQRYWRLRESAGRVYCETSPDGTTWTSQGSHTFAAKAVVPSFGAATADAVAAPGSARFAGVNTLP